MSLKGEPETKRLNTKISLQVKFRALGERDSATLRGISPEEVGKGKLKTYANCQHFETTGDGDRSRLIWEPAV